MSQSPLIDPNQYPSVVTITDGTGAFVERFIGAALLALASQNSGPAEPTPPYAYMMWADTTTNILKVRNALNTAWISVYDLTTGAPIQNAPTATALASSVTISLTGTITGQVDGFNGAASVAISTSGGVPTGTVIWFPATAAPSGFLALEGGLVSRVTYAGLWTFAQSSGNIAADDATWVAQSAYGQFSPGDGSTTFRLPDARGVVFRGHDNSKGLDSGRGFGTYQADEFKTHQHLFYCDDSAAYESYTRVTTSNYDMESRAGGNNGSWRTKNDTTNYGGTETRMKNIALLSCIKT